jgi:hypothetical protein
VRSLLTWYSQNGKIIQRKISSLENTRHHDKNSSQSRHDTRDLSSLELSDSATPSTMMSHNNTISVTNAVQPILTDERAGEERTSQCFELRWRSIQHRYSTVYNLQQNNLGITVKKNELFTLLGCCAAQIGSYRSFGTTCRPHLQASSSPRRLAWPLTMRPIGCPQTSVINYR